jgi:hypothetical protein
MGKAIPEFDGSIKKNIASGQPGQFFRKKIQYGITNR